MFKIIRSFKQAWMLPLFAAALLAGCGAPPQPIPPVFNLYGYQRMAVVPFADQSKDPALGQAIQDEMVSEVLALNAMPVIDGAQVGAYLKSIKADPSTVATDADLRKKIGQKFQCDILLVGTATGYTEILKDTAPERKQDGQWGFMTDRKAHVYATAQLMDPVNGTLVWTQKNGGYSYYNTWNPLPVPAVEVPTELQQFADLAVLVKNRVENKGDREPLTLNENDPNVLLYPQSHYFAELRQKAIVAMVDAMVGDFRGHNGWTANSK